MKDSNFLAESAEKPLQPTRSHDKGCSTASSPTSCPLPKDRRSGSRTEISKPCITRRLRLNEKDLSQLKKSSDRSPIVLPYHALGRSTILSTLAFYPRTNRTKSMALRIPSHRLTSLKDKKSTR